uniref:Homologous recombination factor with OB-fold n=1 Tax=Scleropages formosus TaxID=113540 RepID=A0A8C9RQS6_SCLFO
MSSAAVSSASPHNSLLPFASGLVDQMEGPVPLSHEPLGSEGHREAGPSPDDFDDWDLDLEELDENALQSQGGILMDRSTPAPPSEDSVSPAKRMRDSLCGGELVPGSNLDGSGPRPAIASPLTRHVFVSSPSLHPGVTSFTVRPLTKAITAGPGTLKPVSPPALQAAAAGLQSVGSLQSSSHMLQPNRFGPPALTPRPLHTPVFTNHLVQLVSAANKTPQKPGTPTLRPKTRRFPGPAGLLPQQQLNGRSLDDIVVPHPQTPAHGAMAQLRSQVVDEFSGGTWAVMKAEMGLDERSPTCFLHSYSIVMVLRKAALKQLAKNKVPNMAVMLKSLLHTHADAKAVFQDPTGEMQGTVHRRLLEERQGELKVGAVLLLKQVGVFSPSHRNHYLNVTPRNLLRIYPPGGTMWSSTQQSFQVPVSTGRKGEDDLDQLLGELPEESCSL